MTTRRSPTWCKRSYQGSVISMQSSLTAVYQDLHREVSLGKSSIDLAACLARSYSCQGEVMHGTVKK